MNISTGGPHILLFERDQQLTALITSEFQLAGYECHTARTAVEVFDALARYPIRIVLVDLAQAAAARREFWVALDTQRRGRGIHVLTFQCSNIGGYGQSDPDERSQNMAVDLEIDGMSGLMKLVDEVRNRVPGAGSITNTLPRVPRVASTPQQEPMAAQRTGSLPPIQMNNGNSFRNLPAAESTGNATTSRNQPGIYSAPPTNAPAAQAPIGRIVSNSTPVSTNSTTSTKTVSYTDKIRAVLYPNQRNWSTQSISSATSVQAPQELPQTDVTLDVRQPFQATNTISAGTSTMLQRLANGQTGTEGQAESGLAQLSRMVQASSPGATYETGRDNAQQAPNTPPITDAHFMPLAVAREQPSVNAGAKDSAPTELPEQIRGNITTQPLRASPIQDIPVDRPGGNQATIEGSRRTDSLLRTNRSQAQTSAALPPLASITATSPSAQVIQASGTMSIPSPLPVTLAAAKVAPVPPPAEQVEKKAGSAQNQREKPAQTIEELDDNDLEDISAVLAEATETKQQHKEGTRQAVNEKEEAQNQNTMLFDIMQSLPPMPPVSAAGQAVQPQVLNGRATRSLGSVLLAGHLVPQNRLEVAQNIQRMLRGVDLNYQLGEILLMFKLLTPDQLLAASLVSYGMITTAQVSALGRIRQELHSIGLEYDLESLLILFRILTPEQLREAKSGVQG